MFQNYKMSSNEWISLFEVLAYVAGSAVINYVLNHAGFLPFNPVTMAIIIPVLKAVKMVFDGKVQQ